MPSPQDSLLLAMIADAPDAMLGVAVDGSIVAANPAAGSLAGRAATSLIGRPFANLLARADRSQAAFHERQALEGAPQRYDARLVRGTTKEERIVAIASAPFRQGGVTAGTVLSLRDVTEERHAHDTLARSEARYRHLFQGASDAIMTFDALGRFTTVNDAGEVISGYSREELIGRFFGPMLPLEVLPRAVYEFRRALSGQPGQFDTVVVTKSGERRYITVTYSCPQKSQEVLCLIRDATEEKQLQQQLIQSEKMAAIGQLVSGVAHELNNPLASIAAFGQLLLVEGTLTAQQRHSAEVISSEARRAARIVHNLLTFARQHKAEKVYADVNRVLEDTLELRAYELTVRGIALVRDFDTTAPETMVDVYQLQQVIINLVTNAQQAMSGVERPHHRLTIRSRTLPGVIRIEVEDTGPGIPPEALERIFNPFYTTKPVGSGTGLGLSISLGIIGEHGGRIWAENLSGGSRFCIELPRCGEPGESRPSALAAVPAPVAGLRILVADDEAPIRTALERLFALGGHLVTACSSGGEVLEAVRDGFFDVILLDIRMPDISGKQIFERWSRECPDLADRVIFLSGDIVSADLQRFLKDTGRPFLAKPFDFQSILTLLPQQGERSR